jgi:hypothetical protein
LGRFRHNLPEDIAFEAKALALDEVFAFFMNCFHLGDWLIESGAKSAADVHRFFDTTPCMQLCRDVCNGLKHYRLDTWRQPAPENPHWSTTASVMTEMPPEPTHWYFVGTKGWFDMFITADECVAAWEKFLS